MLYNIHTHSGNQNTGSFCIKNVHENFSLDLSGKSVSMGLHPWYIQTDTFEQQFLELKNNITQPGVLAIGECGLDKISHTDWDLQLMAFQRQVSLAEEMGKPLIIHCVKAFQEVLAHLRQVKVPVIFHGINNKFSRIQPVINAGYFLSFGKSLLCQDELMLETFRKTPLEQVFLETDDLQSDISEIYKLAAQIRQISEREIVLQLEKNFSNVFRS